MLGYDPIEKIGSDFLGCADGWLCVRAVTKAVLNKKRGRIVTERFNHGPSDVEWRNRIARVTDKENREFGLLQPLLDRPWPSIRVSSLHIPESTESLPMRPVLADGAHAPEFMYIIKPLALGHLFVRRICIRAHDSDGAKE